VLFTVCHVSLPLRDEYTPHDLPILSTLDSLLEISSVFSHFFMRINY
jgi:hypothetical protein